MTSKNGENSGPTRASGAKTKKNQKKSSGARRNKGTGGVHFVSEGVWKVDVEISRDSVTGRRRRVSRRVIGTRREAEIVAAKLKLADHERRLAAGNTSARVAGDILDQYLEAIETGVIELAPTTIVTSRSAMRTMREMELSDGRIFGKVMLSRLGWREIEMLYAALRESGRSSGWIRRCATVLTQALEFGRKRGLLESNPAKDAQRPKTTRTKPFSPTLADLRTALATADELDPEMADIARLLASTGMRRGELLALRWKDIDFKAREVSVHAAIVDGGPGTGIIRETTKTSDWRDVPLGDAAFEVVLRQKRRTLEVHAEIDRDGYLFSSQSGSGGPIRPDRLSKRWPMARGDSAITIAHIRHFAATSMLDAGESYRTVADILGNSETTLRLHYDGRTDPGKRKAVSSIEL